MSSPFEPGAVFQLVPVERGPQEAPQGAGETPCERFQMFAGFPDVMDVKQASAALSVSPRWLREAIARGEVASFRVGTHIKVPKTALLAFIERGGAQW